MKQASYEQILEIVPFGVILIGDDKMTYVNTAAENILGLSRKKLQTLSFSVLPFSVNTLATFEKVMGSGTQAKIYEEEFVNYFGNKFLLNFYFIPAGGKAGSYLVVMEDRSFVKAIETTKYDHMHIEKMSTLFATMAHEIKNPLGVVKGTVQLMKKDSVPEDGEAYAILFSEIERIEKVIQDLIDYSNPKKVNVDYVDLGRLLNKVVSALQPLLKEKGVGVTKEYDSTLPKILGDSESLYRAFFNVVKNAIEACYAGGKVTVRLKIMVDMKYREGDRDYNYMLFDVSDTGVGIRDEDMKKIFTPFFTTKQQGSGLGMVYTQKVVLDHGGFFKIQSVHNQGTTVSIFLPMKEYA